MNTSSLVSFIQRRAPDWSIAEIIDLINDAQNIILANNLNFNRAFDSSTGTYHKFTTVDGTYSYEMNVANCGADMQNIVSVFTADIDTPYEDVVLKQSSGNTMATVIFKTNPGVADFYIDAYYRPSQITTAATQLTLPEKWHIRGVAELVTCLIEIAEHGKSDRYDMFMANIIPDIHYDLNNTSDNMVVLVDPVEA
jgi:hypothetical protein